MVSSLAILPITSVVPASWNLHEHETIGLTHPFHHDLRSRGVGLASSDGLKHDNTGLGNDFSGWEFYKDTRVMYGTVIVGDRVFRHPTPDRMYWRPDRMICEYQLGDILLHEEKFIAGNDVACTVITSSKPVLLRFEGQSFFGRHSVTSTASIEFDAGTNAIHISEGGTTKCMPETDRSVKIAPIMYQGMSTVLTASQAIGDAHQFSEGPNGEQRYSFEIRCDQKSVALVWAMHDEYQVAVDALQVVKNPEPWKSGKIEMNRQLNEEIHSFVARIRPNVLLSLVALSDCSIDVQSGWDGTLHRLL